MLTVAKAPGTLCFVAASEKIVKSPNQKVPSPKMNGGSSSPIIGSSGALRNMGRRMSSAQSPGQPQLSPIITNGESGLRAAPRLNTDIVTGGSIPHIQSQNPFRGNRGQSSVQPLNPQAGLSYSPNGYVSQTSPVHDEQYLDQNQMSLGYAHYLVNPQQQQPTPHRNSVATSHGYPAANPPPHPSLRRNHPSPNISQQSQSYAGWTSQLSNTPLVNGMYSSPYSPNTQSQHSPHGSHSGHPSHAPQSASNPPTPVTATSYQQLPPHPLPPMHQHQQSQMVTPPSHDIPDGDERGEQQFETPAMAGPIRSGSIHHQHQHISVSYSDFLENEHDLGAVQENAVSVEDGQQGGRSK